METLGSPDKQLSDEAQLLKEGRQLVTRAVQLSTQTHKIKVWVPILCSMVLTGYYLYGLHKKATSGMDLTPPAAQAPAAVAETEAASQKGATAPADAPQAEPAAAPDFSVSNSATDGDIRKQAEQAHAAQQFGDEGKLWQQFMDRSGTPQAACPAIGKAYERAGEVDLSIQAYEKCMSLDGGNLDTAVAFAHVLETKRDFKRAASVYHQVLSKDPGNLDAQTGMALLELKQSHLHEAEAEALRILHKAPNQTDALLIAGIVAWRESRLPDAERIFLRGAALDDRRADFHGFLGRIAEAERRPQDALREYDKALALDGSDAEIAERRDRLQQAH
jgi:tetratricopeptide (TPR) repeat protein